MAPLPCAAAAPHNRAMVSRLQTWWMILRIGLEERLVYRGDFALGTLMRFLPIVTQVFLWHAIFQARGDKAIEGYKYEDFVAYYLLTMVARAFSSMPGLASGISRTILTGDVKKYLTQPVDMLGFLLLNRLAHKLAYYAVAIGPFALVFFLCRGYFTNAPTTETWIAFVISLVLGFVLGYFLEACMGLVGFWFGEIGSLLFVYMLFSFFLSGHMFPLDMLPGAWRTLVMTCPLMYLAYFPAAVFLGKISGAELWQCLAIELGWVILFIVLSRVLWWRGLTRYSAYGG
jgi:ABC-2 type transport system permease protein